MRFCLDTCVVIDILKGIIKNKKLLESISKPQLLICTTPINLNELYRGAFISSNPKESYKLIEDLIRETDIHLLEYNKKACELYGKIYADLRKKGKLTQDADLIIACIATTHDATLITSNTKHFKDIKGIQLIKW